MRCLAALLGLLLVFAACGGNKSRLPEDKALFEQGQKAEASAQYTVAIEKYNAIVDSFPESQYRYKALFMTGYVQLEYLKSPKEAIPLFSKLITEYPKCDLADDAAIMRQAAVSGRDLMSIIEDSLKTK